MPLVIPENHVQAAIPIVYGGGGLYGYVTMGLYDFNEDLTPQETLQAFVQAFLTNIAPRIDAGCAIGPAVGTVQLSGGSYATFTGDDTGVGGREDEVSTVPAVSVLINKITGRIGRTGRGRMFVPWLLAQDQVGEEGAIDSVLAGTIGGEFVDMATDMTTAGVAPMLLHNLGVPGGDSPTPIVDFTCQTIVGTQRRRQRR